MASRRPQHVPRTQWWSLPREARRELVRTAGRPRRDLLRAWYTVPHLAELMGVTRSEMETTLKALSIPVEQEAGPGTLRRVYIEALKNASPTLWGSLVDVAQARRARAANVDDEGPDAAA